MRKFILTISILCTIAFPLVHFITFYDSKLGVSYDIFGRTLYQTPRIFHIAGIFQAPHFLWIVVDSIIMLTLIAIDFVLIDDKKH